MLLALLAALVAPAHALSSKQSGPAFDLAAGFGLGGAQPRPAVAGQLSLGYWAGTYDDSFALGRYWWIGPTARVDWHPDVLTVAPMLEIRRGLEVIVAGLYWSVNGGVLVALPSEGPTPPLGWTARAALGGKFRRTRFLGLTARLEAGADVVAGKPSFAGGLLLGFAFARPGKSPEAAGE